MNKNDHKIEIFENFQKTVLYVKHLANAHHSSKFQIDTSIFDLKSYISFYNMTANGDVIQSNMICGGF